VPALGIIGVSIDDNISALIQDLRIPNGVLVTARRLESNVESPLMAGDVIHAVNTYQVRSLDGLRVLMEGFKANSQIVVQIERDDRLQFVTVTIY